MNIKVSVIVPVYGVEKYIERTMLSICNQKFNGYEIIIVDDGTTDRSAMMAEQILEKQVVPYRIIHKRNAGLPSARNEGLRVATGKYVCFIDADDIITEEHLSRLYSCCIRNCLLVAYAPFQITYESNRYGSAPEQRKATIIVREKLLNGFLRREYKIHCCSLLINREYLITNDYKFNEKLRYGEDIDFMWRIFPSLTEIGCTETATYKYLQRQNSLMSNQNIERVLVLIDEFQKTIDALIKKYPQDDEIFRFLRGKTLLAFFRTFAETSSLEVFKNLLVKVEYKKDICRTLLIGNGRIAMLAAVLLASPKLFMITVKAEKWRGKQK